jgi:HlyD family secretion protein
MRGVVSFRTSTEAPVERGPLSEPPTFAPLPPRRAPLSFRAWLRVASGFLLVLVAWLAVHYYRAERSVAGGPQTATATREDFVTVLRLTGTTAAVRARPILAPTLEGAQLGSMVITKLSPAGSRVKAGDLLAEFDRQAQIKDALTKRGAYQDLVDQLEEKRAAEAATRAKDETELKLAEDDLQKARLEVSKNDIVSHIDAEKNVETLSEAEATLKQLQHTFKLKREAAAADIRSLAIQADRAKQTMLYAESNARKMRLTSPMDGVVVLNMVWTGSRMGEVQEGDEVRAGLPFMKVVDPSRMNVSVPVNQADFLRLHVGQRARVHLDAYPALVFSGRLEELSPLAHAAQFSDKVRTFSATFALDGNNPKLMPDLSAAVDVELDNLKEALVVPIQSVESRDGRDYVRVRAGAGFVDRRVKTGPRNDLGVVIESGLRAGDVVKRDAAGSANAGIS